MNYLFKLSDRYGLCARDAAVLDRLSSSRRAKDPIARFEATMGQVSEPAKERFYNLNFAEMMGNAA
jgi:hypothetical protein